MDARTTVRRVFRRMVRARQDRSQKRPRGHFQPLSQHPARGIARDNPPRQPGRCQLTHNGLAGITPQARLRFHRSNRRADPMPEREKIGKEPLCLERQPRPRPQRVRDHREIARNRIIEEQIGHWSFAFMLRRDLTSAARLWHRSIQALCRAGSSPAGSRGRVFPHSAPFSCASARSPTQHFVQARHGSPGQRPADSRAPLTREIARPRL